MSDNFRIDAGRRSTQAFYLLVIKPKEKRLVHCSKFMVTPRRGIVEADKMAISGRKSDQECKCSDLCYSIVEG